MESRYGLIVDVMATTADGRAERDAALRMCKQCNRAATPFCWTYADPSRRIA
jgi:hypothetical protein